MSLQISSGNDAAAAETLRALEGRRVEVLPASRVRTVRQRYLYDPFLPLDVITLVAGSSGVGKSSFVLDMAAKASWGKLPGDYMGTPSTIALTTPEDTHSTQRLRLEAAGADLDRILFLNMAETVEGETIRTGMSIPDDLDAVGATLVERNIVAWIIDPITSPMSGDTNKRDDVRKSMDALAALAQRLHITIIGLLHFNKGQGNASEKISGSHAFRDASRSLILMAKEEGGNEGVLTLDKSSYTSDAGSSWSYTLTGKDVTTSEGETQNVVRVESITPTDTSVNDLINRSPYEDDTEDRNAAEAFIHDYLLNQGGEAPANDVIKAGAASGFDRNELKHARSRSRNPHFVTRKSGGKGAGWVWAFEDDFKGATPKVPTPDSTTVAPLRKPHETNDLSTPKVTGNVKGATSGNVAPLNQNYSMNLDALAPEQFDAITRMWEKKLAKDPRSLDAKLAQLSPVSLELLNQCGGLLKSATDAEYQRRADTLTQTA